MPSLASVVGYGFLGILLYRLIVIFIRRWVPSQSKLKELASGGSWAVITGASDGIGREFAIQLAQQGFNVCLMARSMDKLKEVASQVKRESGVETECIAIDFSRVNLESLGRHLAPMLNRPVSVLVNNVGVSHEHPEFYGECDPATIDRIISVNVTTPLRITRILMPYMLQR